jgi:hypothetical protein
VGAEAPQSNRQAVAVLRGIGLASAFDNLMSETRKARKIGPAVAWVLLALTSALFGASLGGLWVRLFVPKKQMGWDALADIFGGLMLGALIGLVAGVVLAAFLSMRGRFLGSAVATLAMGLVFAGLVSTGRTHRLLEPAALPKKSFPIPFSAAVRVSHSEEILRAVPPGEEPIPFTEAKVWTVGPEVIRVGWGPELEHCSATPTEADLEAIVPVLRRALGEAGPICRTEQEGDLILSFAMRLEDERASASVEAGCLADRPALTALVAAIAELVDRLDGQFACQ